MGPQSAFSTLDKTMKCYYNAAMNKTIDFEGCDIIFEITRFCNMNCPHCMRGDFQRKRIKKEYIDAALKNVKYISTLTVSGGEPALAVDLIEYVYNACSNFRVSYANFWMATNGMITRPSFFNVLERLYRASEEKDLNGLRVSVDGYHDHVNIYPFREFVEKMEWMGEKVYLEEAGAPRDSMNLIGDGRAAENYYTTRKVEHQIHLMDDCRIEGSIYVNANGYIISTGDISYEKMDNEKDFTVGHVTDDWQEIFNRFFEKHSDLVYD